MKCLAASILLASALALFPSSAMAAFDFADYQALLDTYLLPDRTIHSIPVNVLDYARMKAEQEQPGSPWRSLLGALAGFDPSQLADRDERMAFWINVYNIAAIKTLLDHYPVDSIRSRKIHWLGLPWKRDVILVGGRPYSLHQIEFDLLVEGFRDLRAHLGINCASVSCADLRPEAYRGEVLDRQLREQGERLAAQVAKGLRIDLRRGLVHVSQIFKFDREHFDAWAGGAIPFLIPYLPSGEERSFLEQGRFDLEYLEYDWTANDLRWVDGR